MQISSALYETFISKFLHLTFLHCELHEMVVERILQNKHDKASNLLKTDIHLSNTRNLTIQQTLNKIFWTKSTGTLKIEYWDIANLLTDDYCAVSILTLRVVVDSIAKAVLFTKAGGTGDAKQLM